MAASPLTVVVGEEALLVERAITAALPASQSAADAAAVRSQISCGAG